MAKYPTMPLRTDALIADTSHLSPTEFGAYVRMLVAMWRNGGWLLNDEKRLARYATLSAGQWARSRGVLMELFRLDEDGRITQGRLTREWAAVEQKSLSAKDSADARWRKNKETGDAGASGSHMPADAIHDPVSKEIGSDDPISLPSGKREARADREAEFSRVWEGYPRKVGRADAERAWVKARAMAGYEDIAGPLREFIRRARGDPEIPVPHLATWLNKQRWQDDQSHTSNAKGNGNGRQQERPDSTRGQRVVEGAAARYRARHGGPDPDAGGPDQDAAGPLLLTGNR